ncbi:NAD(P)H-binding protein [Hydrocarboniphaga sp.]|uniref:NAD(P)H-binding protein n=1 Tax=Hydrocarboniphaga sp. TaxID=2033016 RepID=UPI003D0E5134
MNHSLPVAIVGATGVTGGFAFDEAQRRGLNPIAIGRSPARLEAFLKSRSLSTDRLRVADVHDMPAIKRALAGVAVVISTVAPFSENGIPVARAAAEMGIGYTDCSGEGGFMRSLIAELDAVALRTGASLCTGNGAAAFIGDIAMQWITDRQPDSGGALLYDIRDYRPSFGTIESYLKYIIPGGGPLVRDGVVSFMPLAAFSGVVAGIKGFHSIVPDPLVISRYWPARSIDALFRSPHWLRGIVAGAAGAMLWPPLRNRVLKLPLQKWLAYDAEAGHRSSIIVIAEFRAASGAIRCRRLRGHAVYPLTGAVLAATAQAMLRRETRPPGLRAASEMFASFEEALELSGLKEIPLV